jgi:hypothetical protein
MGLYDGGAPYDLADLYDSSIGYGDLPPLVDPSVLQVGSYLADLAYSYLPQYVRDADDGTVYALLGAACAPVKALVDVLRETTADPMTVPAARLPWVAAAGGVDLTSVPDADKRAFIASDTSRYRGNRAAIVQRVGLTLTGARRVFVECPYLGDPARIRVRTYAAETPDPTATAAAIRAEVPAWLRLTIDTAAGMTWDQRKAKYGTFDDEKATGKTYDELAMETP